MHSYSRQAPAQRCRARDRAGLHAVPAAVAAPRAGHPARAAIDGLATVISRLQGWEAAAAAWEPELFARRMRDYDAGRARPALPRGRHRLAAPESAAARRRRAPRARRTRRRRSRSCSATISAGCSTRRATGVEVMRADESARPRRWSRPCARGGACFAAELAAATGRLARRRRARALGRRGARAADRRRLRRDPRPGRQAERRRPPSRRDSRGSCARRATAPGGRRSVVARSRARRTAIDRDELAEAVAELLLAAGGAWCSATSPCGSRSGSRGATCSARCADSKTAASCTAAGSSAGSAASSSHCRPRPNSSRTCVSSRGRGERVVVNATDPCNLAGLVTPGAVVPSVRTREIVYVDGIPEVFGHDTPVSGVGGPNTAVDPGR